MDKDLYPNRIFDWTEKIKHGKFNKFNEQYLNVFNCGDSRKPIKLSNRIKDLKLD